MPTTTFRPLVWDGPTTDLRRSGRRTFTASWSSTLELLSRELDHLDAERVVLQAGFSERDILLDGSRPRAGAKPDFPGVRVLFDSRHGPLVYQTDVFDDWQANVRAIALALEALRQVDRYGVSSHAEQYKGWRAIEAGPASLDPRAAAAAFIAEHSTPIGTSIRQWADVILSSAGRPEAATARGALRIAAKNLHPDTGGDVERFRQLQDAREVLGL